MGGGGSTEVKETANEQAQADVAQGMWNLYQQKLAPYEDMFIRGVEKLDSPGAYTKAAGDTSLSYASQFSNARDGTEDSLTSAGIIPNSGKFGTAQNSMTQQQTFAQNDAVNRSQSSNADQYIGGLQDALAIGSGQEAGNMQALDSLADASNQSAISDARAAQTKSLGNMNAIGSLAGAGTAVGVNKLLKPGLADAGLTPQSGATGNIYDKYAHQTIPDGGYS